MTLYDRYKGRYSNEIHAALQIVCAAICNNSSERKLSVIAAATGATFNQLRTARSMVLEFAGDIDLEKVPD